MARSSWPPLDGEPTEALLEAAKELEHALQVALAEAKSRHEQVDEALRQAVENATDGLRQRLQVVALGGGDGG